MVKHRTVAWVSHVLIPCAFDYSDVFLTVAMFILGRGVFP